MEEYRWRWEIKFTSRPLYCQWQQFAVTPTPCSTVSEKLTVPQLVKKFPTYYGTRMIITAFTKSRHLSLARTMLPLPTGQEVRWTAESVWSLGKMKSYPFLESIFTDKCKHICLLFCPPEVLWISVCLSVYQSMQLNLSTCLSLYPSLSITVCLFIGLYIYYSTYLNLFLCLNLFICISVCLLIHLSVN
jgi:hypothetical protein